MATFIAMNSSELEVEESGHLVHLAITADGFSGFTDATPQQAVDYAHGILLAATAADEQARKDGFLTTLATGKQRTTMRRKLLLAVTKLLDSNTPKARRRG